MAEFTFEIAAAFAAQGTNPGDNDGVNTTLKAITSAVADTDGLVLGDRASGIGESGIDFQVARGLREKAVLAKLTPPPSAFLREDLVTLTIAVQLAGNGDIASATPVAADFPPRPGIDALLKCSSLFPSDDAGIPSRKYTPDLVIPATCKLWDSQRAWVLYDLIGNLVLNTPPGDLGIATFTLAGKVDSFTVEAFPTTTYGNQATLSGPTVEQVGHNWGMSAAARGFSEMQVTIDNAVEDVPDGNASDGIRKRQTGRTIVLDGTLYSDGADVDFGHGELIRTTVPTEPLLYTVGTPAVGSGTINAYRVKAITPELRELTPAKLGTSHAEGHKLNAVASSAGGEFELHFL